MQIEKWEVDIIRSQAKYEEQQRITVELHKLIDRVISVGSSNVNSLHILQDMRRKILEIE